MFWFLKQLKELDKKISSNRLEKDGEDGPF